MREITVSCYRGQYPYVESTRDCSGTDGILYATDSDGNLNVFNVKRNDDGKQWLNGNNGNPDNFWGRLTGVGPFS